MTRWPTSPLREVLSQRLEECRITDGSKETFVTVRLYGKGAIPRKIGDGKTPLMTTGYRLRSGDLVYSRIDARNGAFALVPRELNGAVVSKDFPSFTIHRDRVHPGFLTRFLSTEQFFTQLQASSFGTTNRQRITEELLLSYKIPVPPLAEQERIVKLLDEADALRKLRAQADRRTADLISALFHDMFGDPEANPLGWSVSSAGDLMDACDYGTSRKANEEGRGVPVLRMGNITIEGGLDLRELKTVELTDSELAKQRLQAGDVLFNRTNSRELVGKTGMWDGRYEAVAASYFIRVRFRPDIEHPQHFTTLMNLPSMKRRLADMARGAVGQANINSKELKSIEFPVPPIGLQDEFAARVAEIRAMEAQQAASRRRLDDLFHSMLHRAFNGEL